MREIKFRAWDKKNKRMLRVIGMSSGWMSGQWGWFIKGEHRGDYMGTTLVHGKEVDKYALIQKEYDIVDIILVQYTGLKDNENKGLYFYDAIKRYAGKRLLGMSVIKSLGDLVQLINEIEESGVNFNIIGNVYENPELLKRK